MKRCFTYCLMVWLVVSATAVHARDIQTYIPVIHLQYDTLSPDTFFVARMQLIDTVDTLTPDTMRFRALIRHRGSTSLKYKKQSYAIKLTDTLGLKQDTALFGMRKDNYWILDAMAPDKARMRNRVAFDLWMDFSTKPYYYNDEPELVNGVHGKFVEVYANGDYKGIYCLMERVDRKQLKLKKIKDGVVRGILYKSVNWKYGFFTSRLPRYDTASAVWGCYEFQYPDTDTLSSIPWEPLYENMLFAITSSPDEFVAQAPERYDMPVFTDYYLFTVLLSARDNMGKNVFLSYYNIQKDSLLVPTPWDIDHSFGRTYDGSLEAPDHVTPPWAEQLYDRLEAEDPSFRATLNARYAALRQDAFDARSLKARFAGYFDLFRQTGADVREQERWSGVNSIRLDLEQEEQYIYDWIDKRLVFCDSIFSYSSVVTALPATLRQSPAETGTASEVSKRIMDGHLYFIKGEQVYDAHGRKVR